MPRLFVAIDLPDDQRASLARLADPGLPHARWAPVHQLHVTLRFLGNIADEAVPALIDALGLVRAASFEVAVSGVGTFPSPGARKPPRILWAALAPAAPVAALKRAVDAALGPDPELEGRPFHPHATLARFKDHPGPALRNYLARNAALTGTPFPVDAFTLYRSELGPEVARHTALRRFPLAPVTP